MNSWGLEWFGGGFLGIGMVREWLLGDWYFSIDGATAKCFLLCFNPYPPPFFLLPPANSPKPPKFFPPPFLLLLLLFAAVWSFLSSHELFLNLHGLDPIHFPCTSFIAFAKSIESIIETNPYPLLFIVFLSLTTLALANEPYALNAFANCSSVHSGPKSPTKIL